MIHSDKRYAVSGNQLRDYSLSGLKFWRNIEQSVRHLQPSKGQTAVRFYPASLYRKLRPTHQEKSGHAVLQPPKL